MRAWNEKIMTSIGSRASLCVAHTHTHINAHAHTEADKYSNSPCACNAYQIRTVLAIFLGRLIQSVHDCGARLSRNSSRCGNSWDATCGSWCVLPCQWRFQLKDQEASGGYCSWLACATESFDNNMELQLMPAAIFLWVELSLHHQVCFTATSKRPKKENNPNCSMKIRFPYTRG